MYVACVIRGGTVTIDLTALQRQMFDLPAVITISIAATRIYRSLVDFLMETYGPVRRNSSPFFWHSRLSMSSKSNCDRTNTSRPIAVAISKSSRVPVQSITVETVEVAEHKTYGQYRMSQTNQDASPIRGEGSLCDKPAGLRLDCAVERGADSGT